VLKEAAEELIYEPEPDVTSLTIEGAELQGFVPIAAPRTPIAAKGVA
jgi:hypothetical protein